MNCEDYREAIATDPSYEGGEAHLSECAGCRNYRDDMRALDRRIEQALSLHVPDFDMPELSDLDTDNVVALPARRRVSAPAWFAIAATVVIAAFVGIRMVGSNVTYPSLAAEIVAHSIDRDAATVIDQFNPLDPYALCKGRIETEIAELGDEQVALETTP